MADEIVTASVVLARVCAAVDPAGMFTQFDPGVCAYDPVGMLAPPVKVNVPDAPLAAGDPRLDVNHAPTP